MDAVLQSLAENISGKGHMTRPIPGRCHLIRRPRHTAVIDNNIVGIFTEIIFFLAIIETNNLQSIAILP